MENKTAGNSIKKILLREMLNLLLIAVGILCAGMGLNGFLLSSNFIDGGITGVSMLLSKTTGTPLSLLIPLINLPFIAIGYRHLGWPFALRSTVAIAGLSIALWAIKYPDVTPDLLLTAVFGGFFIGAGIGLAIRGGAVLDGTEIVALLISKRSDLFRVGDVILVFNVILFVLAIKLLGVQSALYSIITYYTAARTLDFIINGIDEYSSMTIISDSHELIRENLVRELGRGVTIYAGKGGLSDESRDILYCVVTRLEIGKVKSIVKSFDEKAFIVVQSLSDVVGGRVRKNLQH